MEFRKPGLFRPVDLAAGPDLFRPGSLTCRGPRVVPVSTFVYTKFPLPDGTRLVRRPASVGHETILPEPDVLPALFGPDHRAISDAVRYVRTVYGDRDPATGTFPELGRVEEYDPIELRRLALAENLLGRFGYFRNVPVVMLWNQPPGWGDMLAAVVAGFVVPGDGVVTVGSSVLGTVDEIRASQRWDAHRPDGGLP